MVNYWGVLMVAVGAYIAISAVRQSSAIPFRFVVYRARILWKAQTFPFLAMSGLLICVAGVAVALVA